MKNMEHLLFAFGEYKEGDKNINLIIDFVSQISNTDVRYQFGDSGIIVNFTTKLSTDEISKFFEDSLTKITAMFFVFPVNDSMILSMDEDIHKHLFGETDKKSESVINKYIVDSTDLPLFKDSDTTKSLDGLFSLLFSKIEETPVIVLTLDQLLDKINEFGIESLSELELKMLEDYSQ